MHPERSAGGPRAPPHIRPTALTHELRRHGTYAVEVLLADAAAADERQRQLPRGGALRHAGRLALRGEELEAGFVVRSTEHEPEPEPSTEQKSVCSFAHAGLELTARSRLPELVTCRWSALRF